MIGYYVHHHGRGHLHRATALRAACAEPVTVLSSLPPPEADDASWVRLDRDDAGEDPRAPTAGGRLHWAPLHDDGLRRRAATVSGWIEEHRPRLLVADVSVEVALLARLHGVPVVTVLQPGERTDAAHRLGQDASDALVALWPPGATADLLPDIPDDVLARVHALGALSRAPVAPPRPPDPPADRARRVVLMLGGGGHDLDDAALARARRTTPGWEWTVLDGRDGRWVADPTPLLRGADVVVTHAGQNALAEVAAARRPAVVVPQDRPHREQRVTGRALAAGPWPVEVVDEFPADGWAERLDRVADLDGGAWSPWCDDRAAERFAQVLDVVGRPRRGAA